MIPLSQELLQTLLPLLASRLLWFHRLMFLSSLKVVFQRIMESFLPVHPLPSFHNISRTSINIDTSVPSYIVVSHLLCHLAKVVVDEPSEKGPRVLEKLSDVEILDNISARKTPKKRRARKLKGPLDDVMLHRSTRLKKTHGFKDNASVVAGASVDDDDHIDVVVTASMLEVVVSLAPNEPITIAPLEIVSPDDHVEATYVGSAAASRIALVPHITLSVVSVIGTDFLKMQPSGVSKDVMMASSDDE
ncbi:unnamed protein product [Urochloa humidicola]